MTKTDGLCKDKLGWEREKNYIFIVLVLCIFVHIILYNVHIYIILYVFV